MKTAFDKVKFIENDKLVDLYKELKKIGKKEAPAKSKKSKILKELFDLEKKESRFWMDQYYNVLQALQCEILFRVENGEF